MEQVIVISILIGPRLVLMGVPSLRERIPEEVTPGSISSRRLCPSLLDEEAGTVFFRIALRTDLGRFILNRRTARGSGTRAEEHKETRGEDKSRNQLAGHSHAPHYSARAPNSRSGNT
jgi:hypothetical protein